MSVHVRDMCSLDATNPDVAQEFRNGKFVLAKSQRKFSLIAIDHVHEQNNGVMKVDSTDKGFHRSFAMGCSWARTYSHHHSEFKASIVGKRESASQTNHHE